MGPHIQSSSTGRCRSFLLEIPDNAANGRIRQGTHDKNSQLHTKKKSLGIECDREVGAFLNYNLIILYKISLLINFYEISGLGRVFFFLVQLALKVFFLRPSFKELHVTAGIGSVYKFFSDFESVSPFQGWPYRARRYVPGHWQPAWSRLSPMLVSGLLFPCGYTSSGSVYTPCSQAWI